MNQEYTLETKCIKELLEKSFFIPKYQRGYRWKEPHVKDLLNDIWEFSSKQNKEEWYCLQPVVVIEKQDNKDISYEVVDGQQRLTTIFLILKYLGNVNPFNITYETREGSGDFLKGVNINDKIKKRLNIDFFHIYHAYKCIETWFEKNEKLNEKEQFSETLLCSVKVIWYEVPPIDGSATNAIDIFTRINMGKIPLTNAELIKALFLNSSNFKDDDSEKLRLKQLEIASEWDRIEYALQNDEFWYFINTSDNPLPSRIEFIFNLMKDIEAPVKQNNTDDDPCATFRFFSKKFKENDNSQENIETCWSSIKKYFQTLEDWFNDRELYHKIGYLITTETSMKDLIKNAKDKGKTKFKEYLDKKISEKIKDIGIDDIGYYENKNEVIRILLLHNILTMLKNANESSKFPFDRYKKEQWSIEHIHARNSEEITKYKDFKKWKEPIDVETLSPEIKNRIKLIQGDSPEIPKLVSDIENFLFGDDLDDDSIDNLALLSRSNNSTLSNNLFPTKRKSIIELEKKGSFIPICTRKVFQKYFDGYKSTPKLIKWTVKDKELYLDDIKNVLSKYLDKKVNGG